MTRYAICERILRLVYGEQPQDGSGITVNLVNQWVNDGIGIAIKQNYKDSLLLEGVAYVNNSFFTTFKNIPITFFETNTYQILLPQVPVGVERNAGVSSLTFVDSGGNISKDAIPLSQNQVAYSGTMRQIPNRTLYYSEGIYLYALSSLILSNYTARIKIMSGGDSSNLNSVLNVPDDYIPLIVDFVVSKLDQSRMQPKQDINDGSSDNNIP